jgi:hypothetical protein
MKVTNPYDRPIIATIVDEHENGKTETFEIPAGESIDEENPAVVGTLIEYGAVADRVDLDAARELWGERNRAINSGHASASASEGDLIARRQATVDVATGGVDGGSLKGNALTAAIKEANDNGAEIASTLTADEKRDALAAWQAGRGSSTPAAVEYVTNDTGELVLDDDGQPFELSAVERDDAGNVVYVDGAPVLVDADSANDPANAGETTPNPGA